MVDTLQALLPFFAIALGINIVGFLIAFKLQSDKLTDASYALTFVTVVLFALIRADRLEFEHYVVSAVVFLWAARLGSYLLMRVLKFGKDNRFDEMRKSFWLFGRFWVLQGITVPIVLLPVEMFFVGDLARNSIVPVFVAGVAISLFGLLFEAVADLQKFKFITQKPRPKVWIETGLWKYSRHPNYFGEILVWYGLFVAATASIEPLNQVLLSALGPLFIAGLLMFGSGIPILEKAADKKWGKQKKYQEYKARTSILVPLPPKKG